MLRTAQSSASHPQPIDELMERLAQVPERRASFHEIKSIAGLTAPLHVSGTLYYRRPDHIEKITAQPHPEILVVDGERLSLSENNAPSRVLDLDSQPAIRALVDAIRGTLSGDLVMLRRAYHVEMAGDLNSWRLTLTPLDTQLARWVRMIAIYGEGSRLTFVRTIQTNGDESQMTIDTKP